MRKERQLPSLNLPKGTDLSLRGQDDLNANAKADLVPSMAPTPRWPSSRTCRQWPSKPLFFLSDQHAAPRS
jgi:hypothetical protein